MRSVLIWLVDVLIQALILYVAFRLCDKLLQRTLRGALWQRESDVIVPGSAMSPGPSPRRYCLPQEASGVR
jgi:hypothetical protein